MVFPKRLDRHEIGWRIMAIGRTFEEAIQKGLRMIGLVCMVLLKIKN